MLPLDVTGLGYVSVRGLDFNFFIDLDVTGLGYVSVCCPLVVTGLGYVSVRCLSLLSGSDTFRCEFFKKNVSEPGSRKPEGPPSLGYLDRTRTPLART